MLTLGGSAINILKNSHRNGCEVVALLSCCSLKLFYNDSWNLQSLDHDILSQITRYSLASLISPSSLDPTVVHLNHSLINVSSYLTPCPIFPANPHQGESWTIWLVSTYFSLLSAGREKCTSTHTGATTNPWSARLSQASLLAKVVPCTWLVSATISLSRYSELPPLPSNSKPHLSRLLADDHVSHCTSEN